jgi:hypothetical protein
MANVADNSFLLFVYPFLFNSADFEDRVRQVEDAVYSFNNNGQQRNEKVWETLDFPGEDMLAYVADYLNPKPRPADDPAGASPAIARLWRVTDEMQAVYGLADWADWRLKIQKRSSATELTRESLKDAFGLVAKLKEQHDPLSRFIAGELGPQTLTLLEQYDPTRPHIEPLLTPLLEDLNKIVNGPSIYDAARFAHVPLTEQQKERLQQRLRKEGKNGTDNRWLIETAYPREILGAQFSEIPFSLGELAKQSSKKFSMQLALFADGVGFLTVRAKPDSSSLDDWLTFLSLFRFVRGQRTNGVRAQKRRLEPETNLVHEMPFFPEPAGGVANHSDGSGYFTEVLDSLLRTANRPHEEGEWWSEVFIPEQTLPFATLFVDDIPPAEIPELLYRVRNFFTPAQGSNPAPEDLRLDHQSLIPYAREQWFVFSLDGGAFVACNAPQDTPRDREFFRRTLPDHLRDQYFILFLIVLQQRFLLMSLSQQVAGVWPKVKHQSKIEDFEPIRDALLEFAARGMFTQVMQREHHHRCYRKWQETFQIKELYDEVRHEVREMHDFLRMKRAEDTLRLTKENQRKLKEKAEADAALEKRIEKRLRFIGFVFGVPTLIIAFLGINLFGVTSQTDGMSIWLALALSVGSGILGSLVMLGIERKKEKHNSRDDQSKTA